LLLSLLQPVTKNQIPNTKFFVVIFGVDTIQRKKKTSLPLLFSNCDNNKYKQNKFGIWFLSPVEQ